MREIAAQIEDIKARWMVGGSADAACPAEWRGALGERPDLDLLAIVGQFGRIGMRPELAGRIDERPPLPRIALEPVPAEVRGLLRRALDAGRPDPVVALLAARGYGVAPTDWMPKPSSGPLPPAYLPWLDWRSDAPGREAQADMPTAETWDEWQPHARLAAVQELRGTDPAAARDLIAAVAPTLAAEPRTRLVAILAVNLSPADDGYLASLDTDRSANVRAVATALRGRLGLVEADAAAQAELADFFELRRAGILSRREVVVARKLKTPAQRARRAELAAALPLSALAGGLKIGTAKLIECWSGDDGTADIVAMTAATGTDADADRLLERLVEAADPAIDLAALLERADEATRLRHAPALARIDPTPLERTVQDLGLALGRLEHAPLAGSTAFRTLVDTLRAEKETPTSRQFAEAALTNLGLLATGAAAAALIDDILKLGLLAADNRLSVLRLNAALKEQPR